MATTVLITTRNIKAHNIALYICQNKYINSSPSGKTYSTLMHIHFNIGHGLGQFNHSDVLAPQRLVTAELVRSYEHEQKEGMDFPSLCKFVRNSKYQK